MDSMWGRSRRPTSIRTSEDNSNAVTLPWGWPLSLCIEINYCVACAGNHPCSCPAEAFEDVVCLAGSFGEHLGLMLPTTESDGTALLWINSNGIFCRRPRLTPPNIPAALGTSQSCFSCPAGRLHERRPLWSNRGIPFVHEKCSIWRVHIISTESNNKGECCHGYSEGPVLPALRPT